MKYLELITVMTILIYLNISLLGFVDVDPEIIGATKNPNQKKSKIPLHSNDNTYSELRDLNFSVIGPILNKKAKEIDEYYKVP